MPEERGTGRAPKRARRRPRVVYADAENPDGPRLRDATPADADDLTTVERAASLAALGHVFPPDQHPYPTDEVRERWTAVLADPAVTVLVVEDPERPRPLLAFVAFDPGRVRHLGVHPRAWNKGHGRALLEVAVERMERPTLWVLERNHRARGMYEHLGWTPTGRSRAAEFPPYPTEIELSTGT